MNNTILEAKNIKKYFPVLKGLLFAKPVGWIKAVDGIDFVINRGDTLSLVGESGCGKTTTAKLILRLERLTSGSLLFEGHDVSTLHNSQLKDYHGNVQAVFQDPSSSLNPRMRVRDIIAEPLLANEPLPKDHFSERIQYLIELVGLPPGSIGLYPHEFSGGQRQRIGIARSLALNPRLIVLDEPVSALDVSIRAQIMNLLKDLQQKLGLTYLLIAHNLATVRYMSTTVAVMYLGKLVEVAPSEELYNHPLHPYTQALLTAALPTDPSVQHQPLILRGEVPNLLNLPSGCRFHPRCSRSFDVCSQIEPQLCATSENHIVACHLYHKDGTGNL